MTIDTLTEKVNDLIKEKQEDTAPTEQPTLPMLTVEEYSVLSRLYLHPEFDLIYFEVLGELFEVGAMMRNYEERKDEEFSKLNKL